MGRVKIASRSPASEFRRAARGLGAWLRGGVTSVVIPRDESDGRLSLRRRIGGFAVAVVGVLATSIGLLPDRERVGLESVLLLFVLVSVIASAIGGVLPSATAAVLGFFAANWLFTPPYDSLFVQHTGQLLDLILFLAIATGVGFIVEAGSRARRHAARARALAVAIAELDRRDFGDHDNIDRLLRDVLDGLGMDRAELVADGSPAVVVGIPEGDRVAARIPAGDRLELLLYGSGLHHVEPELLDAYGLAAGRLWRSERFAVEAARADDRARTVQLRGARLAASVQEPLAAIRAGVPALREQLSGLVTEELPGLAALERQVERLELLIGELRDAGTDDPAAVPAEPSVPAPRGGGPGGR